MRPVRILVVEDECIVAEDLRERLVKMGTTVVGPVSTGEQALQRAEDSSPDLVLMDIRLKGRLDGIEAADEIRKRLHIPVVYLTAHSDEQTFERARRTEPQGYLLKPFEESDLKVNIELALSKHALEQQLRASERRYATTLASIGDAVIATDTQGCITYMNPVAEELTRWRSAEALGNPVENIFRLINESTRQSSPSPLARALGEGVRADLDSHTLLVTKAGQEVPIDDCAAPICDEENKLQGGVVVFRDVTEKRAAAAAERRGLDQLHWLQRLETIGRFAGGVAHEVNNMLTVVMGCGELLMNELSSGHPLRSTLESMLSAGDRTAGLIRQLLAFSRRQVLAPCLLDLNLLLERLREMFTRLLGTHIELDYRLEPRLASVCVDRMQWEQVFVNLALNARDAMLSGGTLTFETRNMTLDEGFVASHPGMTPGPYVRLTIRDTGCGMDQATQSHLFEPFFTTKEFGKGTGLGLATAYGIVTQSGGHVFVESSVGVGTTFQIYVPSAPHPAPPPEPRQAPGAMPGGFETVLLVEDEPSVRLYVAQSLRHLGYSVLEATHGADALRQFASASSPIHLLLADVLMPKMLGTELAHQLSERQPGLKVLFMSGYTDNAALLEEVSAEGSYFLQKPFTASALACKVRAALDES